MPQQDISPNGTYESTSFSIFTKNFYLSQNFYIISYKKMDKISKFIEDNYESNGESYTDSGRHSSRNIRNIYAATI